MKTLIFNGSPRKNGETAYNDPDSAGKSWRGF